MHETWVNMSYFQYSSVLYDVTVTSCYVTWSVSLHVTILQHPSLKAYTSLYSEMNIYTIIYMHKSSVASKLFLDVC